MYITNSLNFWGLVMFDMVSKNLVCVEVVYSKLSNPIYRLSHCHYLLNPPRAWDPPKGV